MLRLFTLEEVIITALPSQVKGSASHGANATSMSLDKNLANMPLDILFSDARAKPCILTGAMRVPHFANAVFVVAGFDQCLVVTRDKMEYTPGYSIKRGSRQGSTEDRGSYPHQPFFNQGQENCVGRLLRPLQRLGLGGGCNDEWHPLRDVARVHIMEEA